MTSSSTNAKSKDVRPQYREAKHFLWIAIYGFIGFSLSNAWEADRTFDITLFSMALLVMPGIVLHELGHALAAAAVGGEVRSIKLGMTQSPSGPHLPFRFLGFPWELYALPVSGSVRYLYPLNPFHFRSRLVFVNVAGALANLLGAIAAIPYILLVS